MTRIIILVVALAVFLLLRFAVRRVFLNVGKAALAKQPDRIHLHQRLDHRWTDPAAVEALAQPLLARGFADAGTFTIAEMPVALRLFAKADEGTNATIYEHPKAGVWLDMYTRYPDGTGFTIATTRDRGLEQRPGRPIVHAPGLGAAEVHEAFLRERPKGAVLHLTADALPKFYEEAYAEQLAWRKQKGISVQEVANVAKTRTPSNEG